MKTVKVKTLGVSDVVQISKQGELAVIVEIAPLFEGSWNRIKFLKLDGSTTTGDYKLEDFVNVAN